MLNKQHDNFIKSVWDAATIVGRSATRVADHVLRRNFPRTCEQTDVEGAATMLRTGVINEVKRILKTCEGSDEQIDLREIEASFGTIVAELKSKMYFVESLEEYRTIAELIDTPEWLDDAGNHMQRKGEECFAEARILRQLHKAVIARRSV